MNSRFKAKKIVLLIILSVSLLASCTTTGDVAVKKNTDQSVLVQGGARQVIDVSESMTNENGEKLNPVSIDGVDYLPAEAICEALGLDIENDKDSILVKGFAPYYRSEYRDYDIVPIKMSMQAGYNELKPYTSGKTIHAGEGYIDPFGVGEYYAGLGLDEAKDYPIDRYFSKWWMENFSTDLFCVYKLKDGNIYAWDGILGRISNDKVDGTTDREDALVNVIVGGTGAYEGATGILVGHTPSSGELKGENNLPKALFKLMEGFIKLPKDASKVVAPEVTQPIGEFEKVDKENTEKWVTFPVEMIMKAGSHEWDKWTSGFWTIHSGIGSMEPFGQGSYHAGLGFAEAEDYPAENYFNENWQKEFNSDLFCIYHVGDLGDIYVYDGLWSYMLEENEETKGAIGSLAQRQDALINVIIGGTGAFENATGVLVGKTYG
ncbi:MAG: hypothetical protein PQJ46_14840, partial [Spirochaetales bacterium]|nr:hypothetical protein [Spirochaetales bacterium]